MKRRNFLAAAALIPLFTSSAAQAANKHAKPAPKPAAKPGAKKPPARKPGKPVRTSASEAPPVREPRSVVNLPDEPPAQWRNHEITAEITLPGSKGHARIWLPLAQYKDTSWQRSLGHSWQGNYTSAGIYRDPVAEMEVFYAEWKDGGGSDGETPQLQIATQVAVQDRHFDITRRGSAAERTEVLRRCLHPTERMPTDGLVRHTAERAVGRIKDPVAQGKAIYDWVVDNTTHDPRAPGAGSGDIVAMLDSGSFSGRSADIALLFVALCRSMGIPARPVFGLRIDGSRLFSSLGASGNLARAQHCRAEFYAPGYGWIPVDPSDLRKAVVDENLSSADSRLVVLKKLLFGFWEMNWIAYNAAQDVGLRDSNGPALPFLILPQAETAAGRFDSLTPARFGYTVKAQRSDG